MVADNHFIFLDPSAQRIRLAAVAGLNDSCTKFWKRGRVCIWGTEFAVSGGLSGGSVDPHDDVHNGYFRLTLLSTTRLQHVQSDQNAPTRNQQFEVPCSKPRVHYSLKVVPVTRY